MTRICLAASIVFLHCSLLAAEDKTDWVSIFDGTSFKGWDESTRGCNMEPQKACFHPTHRRNRSIFGIISSGWRSPRHRLSAMDKSTAWRRERVQYVRSSSAFPTSGKRHWILAVEFAFDVRKSRHFLTRFLVAGPKNSNELSY